jgi:hypothetical protein
VVVKSLEMRLRGRGACHSVLSGRHFTEWQNAIVCSSQEDRPVQCSVSLHMPQYACASAASTADAMYWQQSSADCKLAAAAGIVIQ